MRIGCSVRSGYVTRDVREGARWMVERARAAWAAGLDSLFVGDHHAVPVPYYQNTAILGRVLAEWGERQVGALYLLPLWNPVLVAEQVGTLAAVAPGPFVLQCAVGGGQEQFGAMGASLAERAERMDAAIGTVRALLAGEEVDGVRIGTTTPEPLEVWVGGHATAAIDRAARLGDAYLVGPDPVLADAAVLVDRYRERCAAHGRAPGVVAIRRDVHVGADGADAERVARPVLDRGYRGFDPAACVVGDVASVADQLSRYAEAGVTDVIIRHLADDQSEVLASYERLAEVRRRVADG